MWTDSESDHLLYRFIREPEALAVQWSFDQASTLSDSAGAITSPTLVERIAQADGILLETYDLGPSADSDDWFVRQRITPGN